MAVFYFAFGKQVNKDEFLSKKHSIIMEKTQISLETVIKMRPHPFSQQKGFSKPIIESNEGKIMAVIPNSYKAYSISFKKTIFNLLKAEINTPFESFCKYLKNCEMPENYEKKNSILFFT